MRNFGGLFLGLMLVLINLGFSSTSFALKIKTTETKQDCNKEVGSRVWACHQCVSQGGKYVPYKCTLKDGDVIDCDLLDCKAKKSNRGFGRVVRPQKAQKVKAAPARRGLSARQKLKVKSRRVQPVTKKAVRKSTKKGTVRVIRRVVPVTKRVVPVTK